MSEQEKQEKQEIIDNQPLESVNQVPNTEKSIDPVILSPNVDEKVKPNKKKIEEDPTFITTPPKEKKKKVDPKVFRGEELSDDQIANIVAKGALKRNRNPKETSWLSSPYLPLIGVGIMSFLYLRSRQSKQSKLSGEMRDKFWKEGMKRLDSIQSQAQEQMNKSQNVSATPSKPSPFGKTSF